MCFIVHGCRFSWLLPILEQEYVADEIVSAVLTNQAMLCLPRIMNVTIVLKRWVKTGLYFAENRCQTCEKLCWNVIKLAVTVIFSE